TRWPLPSSPRARSTDLDGTGRRGRRSSPPAFSLRRDQVDTSEVRELRIENKKTATGFPLPLWERVQGEGAAPRFEIGDIVRQLPGGAPPPAPPPTGGGGIALRSTVSPELPAA